MEGRKIKNYKKHTILLLLLFAFVFSICGATSATDMTKQSLTNSQSLTNLNNLYSTINSKITDATTKTADTTISGTVTQCDNGEPFPGVTVTVNDSTKMVANTITDQNGYYSVTFQSKIKTFDVTASYPGHQSITQEVSVTNSGKQRYGTANFKLGTTPIATFNGLKQNYYKSIYIRYYDDYYGAGTMTVTIDGKTYDAYCIDLYTGISSGNTLLVNGALVAGGTGNLPSGVDWSKVNYILKYYNADNNIFGSQDKSINGAAIQSAIWYFTTAQYGKWTTSTTGKYQFMTDTTNWWYGDYDAELKTGTRNAVRNLAQKIIDDAKTKTFYYPIKITLEPKSSTLPNGDSQTITATVYDQNNNPLSGIGVEFSTDIGALSSNIGTTNAQGQATVTLTTAGLNSGTANLLAWVTGNYGTLLYYDPTKTKLQDLTTTTTVQHSIEDSAAITFIKKASVSINNTVINFSRPDDPNIKYKDYIEYWITVSNNGPDSATGLVISEPCPTWMNKCLRYWVSWDNGTTWTRSDTSYDINTGTWTIGTLPVGTNNSAILAIYGGTTESGTFTNTTTKIAENEYDPSEKSTSVTITIQP